MAKVTELKQEKPVTKTETAYFELEPAKETKGAYRYREVGQDGGQVYNPMSGTLYLRKARMGANPPARLTVVLTGE